jgi:hypothetical protein
LKVFLFLFIFLRRYYEEIKIIRRLQSLISQLRLPTAFENDEGIEGLCSKDGV